MVFVFGRAGSATIAYFSSGYHTVIKHCQKWKTNCDLAGYSRCLQDLADNDYKQSC
jgi:hypothetical protein